jgi:hypothetical protein
VSFSKFSEGFSGASSSKYFNTLSSSENRPSLIAMPTAVDVKLFEADY